MSSEEDQPRSDSDTELEREIRLGRKFSANEAMARMAGPGAMKGASPISQVHQAETEIGTCLRSNLADPSGALQALLHRQLKGSELLLDSLDRPLFALATYCEQHLKSDHLLGELVREADVEWGRRMGERPFFDREGSAPHEDDPYTSVSVRTALAEILKRI